MSHDLLEAARSLPLAERIELAHQLWESLLDEGYEPELTPGQAAELDRRLKDHLSVPENVVPWEAIEADLDARHGKAPDGSNE